MMEENQSPERRRRHRLPSLFCVVMAASALRAIQRYRQPR
jgi:hypothetical protein